MRRVRGRCRHCPHEGALEPRGLCGRCYADPDVWPRYPTVSCRDAGRRAGLRSAATRALLPRVTDPAWLAPLMADPALTLQDVADRAKCSEATVRKWAKRFGLPSKPKKGFVKRVIKEPT